MSLLETMRKQKFLSFALLLFTLSLGIVIGTLLDTGVRAQRAQGAPDATPLIIPNPVQLSTAFSQLAKRLEPSVVNITSDYIPKQTPAARKGQTAPQDLGEGLDFFQRFFQGPLGEMQMAPRRQSGTGSGVIVDPKGYILTNNHVVEQADRIKVRLHGDTTEYDAKLIGADRETDLAVIRIDAPRSLEAATIGNSDAVQVGDWAVAIGSPFGLEATVTAGIISAKEREVSDGQFQHFLQTDAAINPGNSGGPLLNINGEVIGINTAIATSSGSSAGVGFALPINTAVQVYNQIIKTGRMARGSIGVNLQTDVKPELLKVYGASRGAFVKSVAPGSPAEKAGLKEQDVIVSVNGKPVKSNDDLINAIAESPIGSSAMLGIIRDGKRTDVRVSIGDRVQVWANDPRVGGVQPTPEAALAEGTATKLGMSMGNFSQAEREDSGFSEKGGALIKSVDPASFAEDIGLRTNDIIMSVNKQPVQSAGDVARILGALKPGDAVAFRVLRPGPSTRRRASQTPEWTSFYFAGTVPSKE